MALQLSNNRLQLEIQDPGKLYRGSRFDWTGQITQIVLDGKHSFCTNETGDASKQDMLGRGLYNEFGIDMPVGYTDCPVGGQFHKPGIGLLRKNTNAPYDFFASYDVEPAEFSVQASPHAILFSATGKPARGYAYQLNKVVSLEESSFSIAYIFINTGELPIVTNEYVHNFISINNQSIDPSYTLCFSFEIDRQNSGEFVNPEEIVYFTGHLLKWKAEPKMTFFFSQINKVNTDRVYWELRHEKEKLAIRESCNVNVQKVNVWGTEHVVSPEIFVPIDLSPGSACHWERKYSLFTIEN